MAVELIVENAGMEYALAVAKAVSEMVNHETENHVYNIERIVITVDGMDAGLSLVANAELNGMDVCFESGAKR